MSSNTESWASGSNTTPGEIGVLPGSEYDSDAGAIWSLTPHDLDLYEEYLSDCYNDAFEEAVRRLKEPSTEYFLVYDYDEQSVIGDACLVDGRELTGIWIDEEYRGQNFGDGSIFDYIMDRLLDESESPSFAGTVHPKAQYKFAQYGFEPVGIEPNYDRSNKDAVRMIQKGDWWRPPEKLYVPEIAEEFANRCVNDFAPSEANTEIRSWGYDTGQGLSVKETDRTNSAIKSYHVDIGGDMNTQRAVEHIRSEQDGGINEWIEVNVSMELPETNLLWNNLENRGFFVSRLVPGHGNYSENEISFMYVGDAIHDFPVTMKTSEMLDSLSIPYYSGLNTWSDEKSFKVDIGTLQDTTRVVL